MPFEKPEYLAKLKSRKLESHVYRRFQLLGLQIADLLGDRAHKALYIKLVKERGSEELLGLAKRISSLTHVEKKGAYFMACMKMQNSKIKMKNDNVKSKGAVRKRTQSSRSGETP